MALTSLSHKLIFNGLHFFQSPKGFVKCDFQWEMCSFLFVSQNGSAWINSICVNIRQSNFCGGSGGAEGRIEETKIKEVCQNWCFFGFHFSLNQLFLHKINFLMRQHHKVNLIHILRGKCLSGRASRRKRERLAQDFHGNLKGAPAVKHC